MDRVPVDLWGKEYQDLNPGVHGEVDVFSYGATANRAARATTRTSARGNRLFSLSLRP
ncbi:MAG: General secretion pathway protein G [Candidatus Burkholderia crenata]|nr:MAG: General secretion pathway protein G [Candidatus Burkholderia crenata]